ncbi:MAG: methionine--tRNA ligase [Acholeplasmatales bacterium]|nr:methionine--tRNA ligase [Acholeplasmatales bacterium]
MRVVNKNFYISTAIAYSSQSPHIGNVYEIILADAIARFKRLDGHNVYFQTGTDEHGQKIENKAKIKGIKPKEYVDEVSTLIRTIYDSIDISYDNFVRTTDVFHEESVQAIFNKLLENDDIYLGKYQGYYSISEEAFVFEKDLVDGKCPGGDIPIWTEEETYFFRLSKYQDRLIDYINKNPLFIQPESRKNEMLNNFLKDKLPDLSVSRSSFKWGVPILNSDHVIYVWIDALSNYITGLGYNPNLPLNKKFKDFWPADVHLVGKDIVRFHTIYWPIILMALGLELPKQVFGHPWILFNKEKMSKSTGNVKYTDELVKLFGVDVVRYYCLHDIPFAQDGNLTYELIVERNNSDLSNTLGNLVNRTIGMVNKYQGGTLYKVLLPELSPINLSEEAIQLLPKIRSHFDKLNVSLALDEIVNFARDCNKYIDLNAPWTLYKETNTERLKHVLYTLIESIRFIGILLQPFIPSSSLKILDAIKVSNTSFESLSTFGLIEGVKLDIGHAIFERFDLEKKIKEIEENV